MKRAARRTVSLLVGGGLVLFTAGGSEQGSAQPAGSSTELFRANPASFSGPTTSVEQATRFDRTVSLPVEFAGPDRQRAVISSTPDGLGTIIIDNFLTINRGCRGAGPESNVCVGIPGQIAPESCVGEVIDANVLSSVLFDGLEDVDMRSIFTPLPPIDVSAFIPEGPTTVRFRMCDFGGIEGNTDLFLVITPQAVDPPPCNLEERAICRQEAGRILDSDLAQCNQQYNDCLDRFRDTGPAPECYNELTGCIDSTYISYCGSWAACDAHCPELAGDTCPR